MTRHLIATASALSLIALPATASAAPRAAGTNAAAPLSLSQAAPVRVAAKGGKAKFSNAGIAAFVVIVIGGAVAALAVIAGTRDQNDGIAASR